LFGGFAGNTPMFDSSPGVRARIALLASRPDPAAGWLPDAGEVSRFSRV